MIDLCVVRRPGYPFKKFSNGFINLPLLIKRIGLFNRGQTEKTIGKNAILFYCLPFLIESTFILDYLNSILVCLFTNFSYRRVLG